MKSPAFQIYPAEFLADANTIVMSTAEVGAYCLLLFVCWREDGLPDDVDELAVITRMPLKQFQIAWEKRLQRCFQKRDDGKWSHKRLEKERVKQAANRAKRQAAGLKGAESRWQAHGNAITESEPRQDSVIAKNGLADCSLQSSISTAVEKKERRAKPRDERTQHPALIAYREVRGRFPSKDVWDLVISTLGDHPDVTKMKECWLAWRSRNYGPENLGWLVDWYLNGIQGVNGSGKYPTASERRVDQLRANAEFLRSGGRVAHS